MFRLNTNVEKKDRSVVSMRDFKGLDTVHSPMNISYQHAIDMRNLINRDGVNRKRMGWKQERRFYPENPSAGPVPAGTWSGNLDFSSEKDGGAIVNVLVHFFYEYPYNSPSLLISGFIDDEEITVEKHFQLDSQYVRDNLHILKVVCFDNRLYIVGAGKLIVGIPSVSGTDRILTFADIDYLLENNTDEQYISSPIVTALGGIYLEGEQEYTEESKMNSSSFADAYMLTAGVTCSVDDFAPPDSTNPNYDLNSTEGDTATLNYKQFENSTVAKANILSPVRKNIASVVITADMAAKFAAENTLGVEVFRLNELKSYTLRNETTSDSVTQAYYSNRDDYYESGIAYINVYVNGQYQKQVYLTAHAVNSGMTYIVEGDATIAAYFVGKNFVVLVNNLYFLKSSLNYEINTVDFEFVFTPRVLGNTDAVKQIINYSTMLTLFGAEGNPSRLFYCDEGNTIFYSEYRNPLYISSQNTITLGTTPITGWIKGTETSLYVFKEFSRQEESLYVINGELITSEDNQYNVDEGEVLFRNKGYTLPESAVNQDCVCNLANDVLIVSKNGVYGITLSANVASTERFARSRAGQIKNLLQAQDLTKAKCIVWDNKMFLSVGDLVFVADARFRASFDGDMADTFNYEWWLWDNIPVEYWVVIQDKLCFVTNDNRLCTFYDGFSDYISDDLLVAVIDGSNVTISNSYAEYNKILLNSAYRACIDSSDIAGIVAGALVINTEKLYKDINDDDTVYFDVTEGALTGYPVTAGTPYTVESIDIMSGQVKFAKEDGTAVAFTAEMTSLLTDNPLRISKAADEEYNMKIDVSATSDNTRITDADDNVVRLIEYNGVSSYSATIFKKKPVVAYWQTGSYDFGSSMYSKTIERFSVAFDRESPKKLKLYYTTAWNGGERLLKDLKENTDFDFDAFSFLLFSFDKRFETSYTRRLLIRNFNFIAFRILSDEAEDFSVDSMSFVYKVNKLNRGEH